MFFCVEEVLELRCSATDTFPLRGFPRNIFTYQWALLIFRRYWHSDTSSWVVVDSCASSSTTTSSHFAFLRENQTREEEKSTNEMQLGTPSSSGACWVVDEPSKGSASMRLNGFQPNSRVIHIYDKMWESKMRAAAPQAAFSCLMCRLPHPDEILYSMCNTVPLYS